MAPIAGFTIDGPSTKDIDDGISIAAVDGGHEVTVSISDAAAEVRVGSPVDEEAMRRTESRYFAEGSKPMLPRSLSEGSLSLLPGEERRVIAARMFVGDGGRERELRGLSLETFVSRERIDFAALPSMIQAGGREDLLNLSSISFSLLDQRRTSGALSLYDLNQGWVTTEDGFVRQLKDVRETIGYIIVQEMMILANSLVAEWCVREEVPVLFRNHTARPAAPPAAEVQQEIAQAMSGPWRDLDVVRKRVHMLLNRADYGPALRGHYGLSLPAYTHFTSPIRRYADLVNHRQIRARLLGREPPHALGDVMAIAAHINGKAEAARDGASDHFKGQAEERAWRALGRGSLSGLNDKEIERALKVEAKSGEDVRQALVLEVDSRLAAKTLPVICMTVALFMSPDSGPHPGWRLMRESILRFLVENPEVAPSIWSMASTIAESAAPELEESRTGPPHSPRFLVSASVPGTRSGPVGARTSKAARQRALVALLCAVHGADGLALWEEDPAEARPEASGKAALISSVAADGRDPIAVLQEYCQKNKTGLPAYTFDQRGPSHSPVITCVCRYAGLKGEAEAGSKQDAKRAAAQKVVSQIA